MTEQTLINPTEYYENDDYLSNSALSNFVPIPNFPGYEICINDNIVRSLNFNRKGIVKNLAVRESRGHLCISLCSNGKVINTSFHRIVYEMFYGKVPDGLFVCHNDSNPMNNHPKNLRADTQKSNIKDCMDLGRHNCQTNNPTPRYRGAECIHSKRVIQKSKNGEVIKIFPTLTEAAKEIGRTISCISAACIGRQKTSGGYIWEFIN